MKNKNHPSLSFALPALLSFVFGGLCLSGCVSVNIGQGTPIRSEKVRAEAPSAPFLARADGSADQSWQSEKTGNTISYFSECPESSANLEFLAAEFSSILRTASITASATKFYNGREAYESITEGRLDGIPMKISSIVFKKNGCSYLISYVAREDRFATEESIFHNFLEKFQAP